MTSTRRVTIADVAEAAGVSTTAVSWAMNGKGTLDPRTRARIRSVADELGYRPSVRARRLRAGRSQTIALISTMPPAVVGGASRLGFFMEIAASAARVALSRGYALLLVPPVDDTSFVDRLDVDGALVIEPVAGHWICRRLGELDLPTVAIGRDRTPGSTMSWVERGAAGADVVLEHLAAQGRRDIALLVTAEERSLSEDTAAYYRAWTARHGRPQRITYADPHGGTRAARAVALDLLHRHPSVDAVYAPLDAFALGALAAAGELGLRVPQDLMVATNYDGERARGARPALTALDLRLEELADQAVHLLLDRVEGRAGESASVLGPKPMLVPRASTAVV